MNNRIFGGKRRQAWRLNHQKPKNNIMKKIIRKLAAFVTITLITFTLSAQVPPNPNGGSDPGGGNTPVGGGAPVGSGLVLLIALGAAYGGKKVYDISKKSLDSR